MDPCGIVVWRARATVAVAAMLPLWACGADVQGDSCEAGGVFATEVVSVRYGPGQSFGRERMPEVVLGAPRGAGAAAGSTDVVSLGNGGRIVLGFGPRRIVDGPGPDFVVFENAFEPAGQGEVFAELATVEVSDDGTTWRGYPCTATEPPYGACAGHTPVVYEGDDDGPLDPATSGGDAYDLAEVGLSQARYVRITDRVDLDGLDGVFDLDAVGLVHTACP